MHRYKSQTLRWFNFGYIVEDKVLVGELEAELFVSLAVLIWR